MCKEKVLSLSGPKLYPLLAVIFLILLFATIPSTIISSVFALNLNAFNGPYPMTNDRLRGPVDIDYHLITNKLAVSQNCCWLANGIQLKLIGTPDFNMPFAIQSNLGGGPIKIATVRDKSGGFIVGETFASRSASGAGDQGVIVRISPDGSRVDNPWMRLPSPDPTRPEGLINGLHVDRTGVFGGDLIAVSNNGDVWRISSRGPSPVQPLAQIKNTCLNGVITVPKDATVYGPWAGKILVGAPGRPVCPSPPSDKVGLYTVDPSGKINFFPSTLFTSAGLSLVDFDIVAKGENFYALQFASSEQDRTVLWTGASSEFKVGHIILQEGFPVISNHAPGQTNFGLWDVFWDGTRFQTNQLQVNFDIHAMVNGQPPTYGDFVHHWQGMTFAPTCSCRQ